MLTAEPPPLTDNERRLMAANEAMRAVPILHRAAKLLDGLEWGEHLEAARADIEGVVTGIRKYAKG